MNKSMSLRGIQCQEVYRGTGLCLSQMRHMKIDRTFRSIDHALSFHYILLRIF